MSRFRVALSSDFLKPDGTPAYPMFDLSPLENDPDIDVFYAQVVDNVVPASSIEHTDALILLGARFTGESVPDGDRLSMVARFGVGYDNVDVAACTDNAIAVVITPDGVRRPVAVAVLTFILALAGKLFVKDRLTRAGPDGWAERAAHMGTGLVGLTLGQLGIGNIGAEVFRVARPLDMTFIAHDPFADPALAAELGVELVTLDDLFRRSDFLSISCPLNDETRGLVDDRLIGLMKPRASLINTSRGPVVDQAALTRALTEGVIAGAGLDVFEDEPTAVDETLATLENVILTPHALCWTDQCFAGNGAADVRAALAVMRGEEPSGIVNREICGHDRWRQRLADYQARFGD